MKKIGMNPVSVRYGRYGGYRYRFGIEMGDIGIGNPVSYRVFNEISVSYICIKIGMNPVSVSYQYIGKVSYRYIGTWYRFDMGDFGDIGIGLNILLTDTDISVSVYRYRSNSS